MSSRALARKSWAWVVASVGAALWLASPSPAAAELVAHWRGDGDFTDSAGDNDGVPVGDVGFAPGRVGQAMHFPDGGYLDVPDFAGGGLVPSGAFTVAAFVRIDGADPPPAGGPGSIITLGSTTGPASFSLEPSGDSGGMTFLASTASGLVVLRSEGFNLGLTRHVAVSYDPANQSAFIYADGERVMGFQNQPIVQPVAVSPGLQFLIGRSPDRSGTLDGLVDDLRFYNTALGDAEIRVLANVPEPAAGAGGLLLIGWAAQRRRRRAR